MQLGAFSGAIYTFCNWFYRLAYLNILWIFFTLIGLVIVGIYPATIALLATLRQMLNQNDTGIGKTFWHYYKTEFRMSNTLGIMITMVGLLFYFNLSFLQAMGTESSEFLYYAMMIMCGSYFLFICYLFASLVTFEQKLSIHMKNSFLIMIYNPLANLFIVFGFVAVYFANTFISGLSFFYSISLLGLVILSSANLAYGKIMRKQQSLTNVEST